MELVDSHAHLEMIEDLDSVFARAKGAGVTKIISIGTSIDASKKCIEIADSTSLKLRGAKENIPEIYASCGIHPSDGKGDKEKYGSFNKCIDELKKIIKTGPSMSPRRQKSIQGGCIVVGIGECGLDYFLDGDSRGPTTDNDKEFQRELFSAQIKLACDLNLPLVVHCRNAWEEIFEIIESQGSTLKSDSIGTGLNPVTGVFHSWTGNIEAAKKALDLEFYISFSGIATFKNAGEIAEVAKIVPLDRILVETDSPFLSPEPLRGAQNEPKNVRIIADFLAELRSVSYEEIYVATCSNAKKLFGLE